MEQLKGLSLGRKLVLGAGVLLFLDTFFAWQKISLKVGDVSVASASANAWHGFWGVLLGLLTLVMLVWVVAQVLGVALPIKAPDGLVTLALGVLIVVFAVLKNLFDDYSAWASYLGIVLAAGVAVGAWLSFQESGKPLPKPAAAAPGP